MDTDEHGAGTFPDALSELKANGANVLVVGTVPDDVHLRASRQLLGAPDGPPRRRVLACSGCDVSSIEGRFPPEQARDPDHLRVVIDDVDVRSTSADAAGTDEHSTSAEPDDTDVPGDELPVTRVASDGLGELGTAITSAIADLDDAAGDLNPAELRLCLDSVAALLASHERSAVLVLLHLLTERVSRVDGIGHYHLPVDRDDELVSTFVPLFDVTVALRVRDGRAEQRWHVDDGTTSEWLPLAE